MPCRISKLAWEQSVHKYLQRAFRIAWTTLALLEIIKCDIVLWFTIFPAWCLCAPRNFLESSWQKSGPFHSRWDSRIPADLASRPWNIRVLCMLRGCPLWNAHGIGRPTESGGGAHQKLVQCPNPTGAIGPASPKLARTCTLCVLSVANFTLGN